MSCLWTLFHGLGASTAQFLHMGHSSKSKGERNERRICDALRDLRQVRDRLQRRSNLVTRKVADTERDILELNAGRRKRSDKDSAVMSRLRRLMATRRLYLHGVKNLENTVFLLERQILLLEEAGFQHETVQALRLANIAGDEQRKLLQSVDLDHLLDSIQENYETLNETTRFFSDIEQFQYRPEEEQEMQAELDQLMEEHRSEIEQFIEPTLSEPVTNIAKKSLIDDECRETYSQPVVMLMAE